MNNKCVSGIQRSLHKQNHLVDIHYRNIENSKNLETLHGLVENCSFLFPTWLKILTIDLFDKPNEGKTMDAVCFCEKWEYGCASMDIFASFWDRTEHQQQHILIHELVHVMQGKQLSVVRNDILRHVTEKNKELGEHLERQFREINEEFVEAVTDAIASRL